MLTGTASGGLDNDGVFISMRPGVLMQIARGRQTVPDGNGTFTSFGRPIVNSESQVAFHSVLAGTSGGSTDNGGVFLGVDSGGIVAIAREGQEAPDGNGTFSGFANPVLNDSGQLTFWSSLIGTSLSSADDRGIFLGDGVDGLVTIVREGQAAPDGNATFRDFQSWALNNSGEVAFMGLLTSTSGLDSGVFVGDGVGDPIQIARAGQIAPDSVGSFLGFDSNLAINDQGEVAFFAVVAGTGLGTDIVRGIFKGDEQSGLVRIARQGQIAPDGNGALSALDNPVLNNAGQTAFRGSLVGTLGGSTDNGGIFVGDGDTLFQIAREGQSAPASDGSVEGVFSFVSNPALNDLGQVAAYAEIDTQDGDSTGEQTVLFYDPNLGLRSVARTGDRLDGSTITDLLFSAGTFTSKEGSGLNNLGQVAYAYTLADGRRGVAIATIDSAIAGDANFDGIVDLADFGLLRAGFGSTGDLTRLDGDFNKDGVVDLADFGLLRANFGAAVTSADLAMVDAWAATVPEPTRGLVGFAGLTLVALRRRTG
ncbi:MAG: choice-of-anchor tandem repeat NxxGxxAF-containing protein [Planctomycetota bacterium]